MEAPGATTVFAHTTAESPTLGFIKVIKLIEVTLGFKVIKIRYCKIISNNIRYIRLLELLESEGLIIGRLELSDYKLIRDILVFRVLPTKTSLLG